MVMGRCYCRRRSLCRLVECNLIFIFLCFIYCTNSVTQPTHQATLSPVPNGTSETGERNWGEPSPLPVELGIDVESYLPENLTTNEVVDTFWTEPRRPGPPRIALVSIGLWGHAEPLKNLGLALAELKGYEVALCTHESMRPLLPAGTVNATFLSAGELPFSGEEYRRTALGLAREPSPLRNLLTLASEVYLPAAAPMVAALRGPLRAWAPDLVVADALSPAAADLAHLLRVPLVLNAPFPARAAPGAGEGGGGGGGGGGGWWSALLRPWLPGDPAHLPAWGSGAGLLGRVAPAGGAGAGGESGGGGGGGLAARAAARAFPRLLGLALTPALLDLAAARAALGLPPLAAPEDVVASASRVLVNAAWGLEYPYKLSPLVEMTGPLLPLEVAKGQDLELPRPVQRWLAGGDGLVYVNFGNMAVLDEGQLAALAQALAFEDRERKPRVLWMVPADQRARLPARLPGHVRVQTLGRTPHLKVLASGRVRAAVGACGAAAAQAALLLARAPLVCLPLLLDQPDVAARVADAGAGVVLDRAAAASAPGWAAALGRALGGDPALGAAARRLGARLGAAGGVVGAANAVETALVLGGGHLRPLGILMPRHRAYNLDVVAVISALFCLILVCLHCCKAGLQSVMGFNKPGRAPAGVRRGISPPVRARQQGGQGGPGGSGTMMEGALGGGGD